MKASIIIASIVVIMGCGPHFNMNAKPEPMAPQTDPTKVIITVPNWPIYGYMADGVAVILLVQSPETFPIPGQFVFNSTDGKSVTVPMIQPQPTPETK
jgi:hypothetical protein